jgi:hypothetical protein
MRLIQQSEATMLTKFTRVVYVLFGVLYILIGVGSFLLPLGWLPETVTGDMLAGESRSAFFDHLLQEFGIVVLALGLIFLWYARRKELSWGFHWLVTFYFALDALIHWVAPDGQISPWSRGTINTIPFAVMLLLGLLQLRAGRRLDSAARGR